MDNADRKYVVYKHTSPSNKVYIGITCQNPPKKDGRVVIIQKLGNVVEGKLNLLKVSSGVTLPKSKTQ